MPALANGAEPQVNVADAFKVRKEGAAATYATSPESFEPMVRAIARGVERAKQSKGVGLGAIDLAPLVQAKKIAFFKQGQEFIVVEVKDGRVKCIIPLDGDKETIGFLPEVFFSAKSKYFEKQ
jgi:hypothetical protein